MLAFEIGAEQGAQAAYTPDDRFIAVKTSPMLETCSIHFYSAADGKLVTTLSESNKVAERLASHEPFMVSTGGTAGILGDGGSGGWSVWGDWRRMRKGGIGEGENGRRGGRGEGTPVNSGAIQADRL